MRHRLNLLLFCCLSRESAGFVPGGRAASFLASSSRRHADGLRNLRARPTMETSELAGEETTSDVDRRKKVVVIGAGWAGLAAAYELSKQVNTCRICVEEKYK